MNIFVLDQDPVKAAQDHCDKHCVKMILELSQMLCTSHYICGLQAMGKPAHTFPRLKDAKQYFLDNAPASWIPRYKMTHVNHPCNVWVRETRDNYDWALAHTLGLLEEYTQRYGRRHKSHDVYDWLAQNAPQGLQYSAQTPFAQAMPDQYKDPDPVKAYRTYYVNDKSDFAKWAHSKTPSWWYPMLQKVQNAA